MGTFVALILLISMDFWTVKNVTGRLMVGLRWWNFIDDEGNSHWVFENKYSKDRPDDGKLNLTIDESGQNAADASLFWSALILTPVVWLLLLLVSVFRLNIQWFVSCFLALFPSVSYFKNSLLDDCITGPNSKCIELIWLHPLQSWF